MRICLLTRYFNFSYAGIGRFSVEIRNRLEKSGYEIKEVSCSHGFSNYFGYVFYTAFEIPVMLSHCDIYHALSPMEGVWIPKDKSVVTFHDLIPWLYPDKMSAGQTGSVMNKLGSSILRKYFKFTCDLAKRARFIACDSQQTRDEVIQHLQIPPERTLVIKLGIREDLEPQDKPDTMLRFGYLGQLDRRKRVNLLIEAFLDASADGELVIAGTGKEEAALKDLAGDNKRIKFLGFVPDEKLTDFYNSLNYFIFPTQIEGYGLPIVEAMACQKPVVVLADAIIPQEIKSRCTIVDRLNDFFTNPANKCNVSENYQFAKEHTWERCIKAYLELYKKIYAETA